MDISEIQDLIKFIAKAGVTEVEIEKKDFKITIKSEMPKKKGAAAAAEATIQVPVPVAAMPAAPVAAVPAAPSCTRTCGQRPQSRIRRRQLHHREVAHDRHLLPSFCSDKPTFVEVGSTVGNGDVSASSKR